jgi:hypothetical protein
MGIGKQKHWAEEGGRTISTPSFWSVFMQKSVSRRISLYCSNRSHQLHQDFSLFVWLLLWQTRALFSFYSRVSLYPWTLSGGFLYISLMGANCWTGFAVIFVVVEMVEIRNLQSALTDCCSFNSVPTLCVCTPAYRKPDPNEARKRPCIQSTKLSCSTIKPIRLISREQKYRGNKNYYSNSFKTSCLLVQEKQWLKL